MFVPLYHRGRARMQSYFCAHSRRSAPRLGGTPFGHAYIPAHCLYHHHGCRTRRAFAQKGNRSALRARHPRHWLPISRQHRRGRAGLNNAIINSCIELLGIIVVIALVVAMSRAMVASGADQMLMRPVCRIIRTRNTAFWAIGFAMLIMSWLIWPSPAVALIGALLLPVAARVGLPALWAAVAMNLFGHGAGLSSDFFIQGAPDITATAAGVDTASVMKASVPLWGIMCVTTIAVAFWMMRRGSQTKPNVFFRRGTV